MLHDDIHQSAGETQNGEHEDGGSGSPDHYAEPTGKDGAENSQRDRVGVEQCSALEASGLEDGILSEREPRRKAEGKDEHGHGYE
jgi:hypothetical protein